MDDKEKQSLYKSIPIKWVIYKYGVKCLQSEILIERIGEIEKENTELKKVAEKNGT